MLARYDGTTDQAYHQVFKIYLLMRHLQIGGLSGIRERPMFGTRTETFMAVPSPPWLTPGAKSGAQSKTQVTKFGKTKHSSWTGSYSCVNLVALFLIPFLPLQLCIKTVRPKSLCLCDPSFQIPLLRTGGAARDQFPFGFVQLGTNAEQKTENNPDSSWPLIRWHQTADFGVAPNS